MLNAPSSQDTPPAPAPHTTTPKGDGDSVEHVSSSWQKIHKLTIKNRKKKNPTHNNPPTSERAW